LAEVGKVAPGEALGQHPTRREPVEVYYCGHEQRRCRLLHSSIADPTVSLWL
jgi:hypothetical protein